MASNTPPDTGITSTPETAVTATPPETVIPLPRGADAPATDAARSLPMTAPVEEEAWIDKADWLLLGLVVVLGFLVSSVPAYNSDLWMQMATGRLIANGEYSFGADPYSFATESMADRPAALWVNHSWLFGLGLYGLYTLTGGVGLIVAKGLLVVALAVLMLLTRSRTTNLLAMAICMTIGVLTMSSRLALVQPVVVSYLFLGITLFVLNRAGTFELSGDVEPDARQARVLWWLPALFVLWVNLDNWFVLGPIVVGLCWAGLALQRLRGMGSAVPLRLIGIVFGVGLLACVVNPFHVRAFQLPAELAYPLVRAGEAIEVPAPDWLCAGGKTLATLRDVEPKPTDLAAQVGRVLSPFEAEYRTQQNLGWNIAGMCIFALLAMGAISFALHGVAAVTAEGPALQSARFAVWLFAALLAVANFRLAPFFAIVAAPITAMNVSELVGWYTRPAETGAGDTMWMAPIRMARLLGVPLMLALLALAWPGWLHGPFDQGSPRHVAWEVVPDVSLREAAERLGAIQKAHPDKPLHVFSTGEGLGHYCAWHAPGVKCFFDGRHNLLEPAAHDYATARLALLDKKQPTSEWMNVFNRYEVDHVAVERFLSLATHASWWIEPDRWLPRYGDKQVAVFAWSRDRRWPADAMIEHWNRQAFGEVASADRPPAKGPPAPPEEARSLFERHFYPAFRMPRTALEMDYKLFYMKFVAAESPRITRIIAPRLTNALARLPIAPGAVNDAYGPALTQMTLRAPIFNMPDLGPPAIPILVTRLGWQTVAETPANERCHAYLANAYTELQAEENKWVAPGGGKIPPTLRDTLRRIQIVSARRTAVDLGFADPRLQLKVHLDLASQYHELHFLDLAADHLAVVDLIVETLIPDDPTKREAFQKERKNRNALRKELEMDVELRKQHFNIKAAGLKPIDKVAFALAGNYTKYNKDNKGQPDPKGLGLAGLALQLLQEVDQKTLTPEQKIGWLRTMIDLLFNTGNARQAAEFVEKSSDTLERLGLHHRYLILSAGTQGDYDALRRALVDYERLLARQARDTAQRLMTYGMNAPPIGSPPHSFVLFGLDWTAWARACDAVTPEYYNVKTLRGVVALEAGDTGDAYTILQSVLQESANLDGLDFADRPIAERYVTFLKRYRKK